MDAQAIEAQAQRRQPRVEPEREQAQQDRQAPLTLRLHERRDKQVRRAQYCKPTQPLQADEHRDIAQADQGGELTGRHVQRIHQRRRVRLDAEVIVNEPAAVLRAFAHRRLVLAEVAAEPECTHPQQVRWTKQGGQGVRQAAQNDQRYGQAAQPAAIAQRSRQNVGTRRSSACGGPRQGNQCCRGRGHAHARRPGTRRGTRRA